MTHIVSTEKRCCSDEYLTSHPEEFISPSSSVDAISSPPLQTVDFDSSELVRAAYLYAIRLLTKKEYSVPKIRRKLLERENPREVVEQVIERLVSANYLSNERYIEARVRGLIRKNLSASNIQLRLQQEQLSVPIEQIEDIFAELKISSQEQIENLLERKSKQLLNAGDCYDSLAKIVRYLQHKGHAPATTLPIIKKYLNQKR